MWHGFDSVLEAMSGLSLLVPFSALSGFSQVLQFSPLMKNNNNLIIIIIINNNLCTYSALFNMLGDQKRIN